MSDAQAEEQTAPDIVQAMNDLQELIKKLVPQDNLTIKDIFGDEHEINTSVSARKQIKVVRIFDNVKDIPIEIGQGNLMQTLLQVAQNETVLLALAEIFEIAYPQVVAQTQKVAKKKKVIFEKKGSVADLFPLEEVIDAIVPLFIRVVKRTHQAIQALNKTEQSGESKTGKG